MESFEKRKTQIRSEIGTRLDTFETLFTEELTKKLAEYDALQKEALKVVELEAENSQLCAKLEAMRRSLRHATSEQEEDVASRGHLSAQNSPKQELEQVEVKEYNRVKALLAKSDQDYAKFAFAHRVMETRLRHYKDMTKQWREYTERWILKPSRKKQLKYMGASSPSPTAFARDSRSSSVPAPPPIPPGLTPSVSSISRSTSPWTGEAGVQPPHHSHQTRIGSPRMLPDRIMATQMALSSSPHVNSGDPTEASDDSESHPRKPLEVRKDILTNDARLNPLQYRDEDDDAPIIVSERSLQRKRPIHVTNGEDLLKDPVKTEITSSSPLPAPTRLDISGPHDSLDLDDVGGHVDTPRKRRKMEQMRLRSSTLSLRADQYNGKSLKDTTGGNSTEAFVIKDEGGTETAPNDECHSSPFSKFVRDAEVHDDGQRQRKQHKASSRAQQQAHNNRVHERLEAGERTTSNNGLRNDNPIGLPRSPYMNAYPTPMSEGIDRSHTPDSLRYTEQRRAELASPTVLQPTDPNAHILPRTNTKVAKNKSSYPPSRRDRSAACVPALAEDGDDSPSVSNKAKGNQLAPSLPSEKQCKVPDAHHRLGTLLHEASPAKSLLDANPDHHVAVKSLASSKPPASRSDRNVNSKAPATPLNMPEKRSAVESAAGSKASTKQSMSVKSPVNQSGKPTQKRSALKPSLQQLPSTESPVDNQPEHEPLRARPIHRLSIADFKFNPAHSDYAYQESVRKHDEKQAISGCTDRNCPRCKDIRKFVENSGYATLPGRDTEEIEQRLLEDYLGGDTRRLGRMSTEERKEILLQAKTKQFADKFGKHRTSFGRAQSPVGFWNVDFPSTQEHEANREAARLREREKVEEMYWEAIRKGGRYVFADE